MFRLRIVIKPNHDMSIVFKPAISKRKLFDELVVMADGRDSQLVSLTNRRETKSTQIRKRNRDYATTLSAPRILRTNNLRLLRYYLLLKQLNHAQYLRPLFQPGKLFLWEHLNFLSFADLSFCLHPDFVLSWLVWIWDFCQYWFLFYTVFCSWLRQLG